MKLFVDNSNTDIDIFVAKSSKAKIKGLSGIKKVDFGLFFPETNCIHTLTMKDELDIIFFNGDKIVKISENVKPGKPIIYHPLASSVLELPSGTIKKEKILKKSEIIFKNIEKK